MHRDDTMFSLRLSERSENMSVYTASDRAPASLPTDPMSAVWSAELARAVAPYLDAARWHWAAGRADEAVAAWESALRDIPGLPAPRRHEIAESIRRASYQCAKRAVQMQPPDWGGAARWLGRWLQHADGAESGERRRIRELYGMMLHLNGQRDDALRIYRELESDQQGEPWRPDNLRGRDGPDWLYGAALLRLQMAVPAPVRPFRPASALAGELSRQAARARLRALESLLAGDAQLAAAVYPGPDQPGFPGTWALAGGLLAALAGRWSDSVAYFDTARSAGALDSGPLCSLARLVFAAAALRCAIEGVPLGPDVEAFVMKLRIPARPPRADVSDIVSYSRWAASVRQWQQQLWVRRALSDLAAGDVHGLENSLRAIARLRPSDSLSRWVRVWLACARAVGGAVMERRGWLRRSEPAPDAPRHLWWLSVLAAEQFGAPAHVVERLNRLLERFPDDEWALARWRAWMLKLAQDAVDEGRFKQALFQYASLVLYLPDDPDGWAGCARILELMDAEERAADCRRQAQAAVGCARRAAEPEDGQVRMHILRQLLAEPLPVPAAAFPFSSVALRRAVLQSLHEPDAYLRCELERWAVASTS